MALLQTLVQIVSNLSSLLIATLFVVAYLSFVNIHKEKTIDRIELENKKLRDENAKLKLDGLTGTLRRETWEEQVKSRLLIEDLVIVIIDLDNLKEVNDIYGHVYGDKMITLLASSLRCGLREGDSDRSRDLIGRYGGDEFVVAFSIDDSASAEEQVSRIFTRVHERFVHAMSNLLELNSREMGVRFGFSYGDVYVTRGKHELEVIYCEADNKLYSQKANRSVLSTD